VGGAVHLDDTGRVAAGALVQLVDVLGDDRDQPLLALQLHERPVTGVGLRTEDPAIEP